MHRRSPPLAVVPLAAALAVALAAVLAAALSLAAPAFADERTPPLADVIDLEATVSTDVVPDLAVVSLAIVREGPDVAPLTKDVNDALARAFADAKAVPGVIAANGGYGTAPRFDSRGATRTGWQVRATIVLKSKDFAALGALVGRLSSSLQISGSGFEISPELRQARTSALLDDGARAFREKAAAAARAFGYGGYGIRQITIGSAGTTSGPRMMAMAVRSVADNASTALPIEAGPVTLSLTINGSLQMR